MCKTRGRRGVSAVAVIVVALIIASSSPPIWAASHREAPLIALEPAADNTDVYAFVSYEAANLARPPAERKVTLGPTTSEGDVEVTSGLAAGERLVVEGAAALSDGTLVEVARPAAAAEGGAAR